MSIREGDVDADLQTVRDQLELIASLALEAQKRGGADRIIGPIATAALKGLAAAARLQQK